MGRSQLPISSAKEVCLVTSLHSVLSDKLNMELTLKLSTSYAGQNERGADGKGNGHWLGEGQLRIELF